MLPESLSVREREREGQEDFISSNYSADSRRARCSWAAQNEKERRRGTRNAVYYAARGRTPGILI